MSPRRTRSASPADPPEPEATLEAPEVIGASSAPAGTAVASLSDLPVAGLTRRRIAILIAALVAAWVIVLFARQVSEASEATARADAMRASNVVETAEVTALKQELALIQRQAYIEQQARSYRLGPDREIPFVLADDAPPLAQDAPGMPAVKLGAQTVQRSPLGAWLDLLFGPGQEQPGR